jgi:pilus assembly protein FimV
MLVAMLRGNPNAFIDGNVNRIKADAVLDLPAQAEANAIAADEARQVIAAQSRDFNDFRRRLSARVPTAAVASADRQASGRIQAEVEDKKPAAQTQDKLTLSKGASSAEQEAKIAQERQSQEAASRAAELSRNIEDLAKLGTSTAAATTAAVAAATPTTPGLSVPGTAATTTAADSAAATAATATETATTAATETAAPTEAAAPAPAAPPPLPAPAAEPESPGFIAQLMDNPVVLPAAGGLLALLAGLGLYRMRQRKKGAGVDSSFLESRLQPDSFFGSSGGQRIDTAEAAASGSSMVYSPSQLDAAGDVDPVAEADVYLAYGRDLQAEEILKEAMRSTPTRVAIHNKLLEIYAKRRDAKAFEVVATEAFGLTQGQGPEWEHACEMGKDLDPGNPLYQPGGTPAPKPGAPADAATIPFGASTLAQQHTTPGAPVGAAEAASLGLDLDLDLDEPTGHGDLLASAPAPVEASFSGMDDLNATEELTDTPVANKAAGPDSMSMDFDLDFPSEPMALPSAAAPAGEAGLSLLDDAPTFDAGEVLPDFSLDQPPVLTPVADDTPVAPPPADMLAFDLSDINLDLDKSPAAEAPSLDTMPSELSALTSENPLETKLSLAEEFRAIGDLEGARSLAEEVLAEASGTLKSKASAFLNDLA